MKPIECDVFSLRDLTFEDLPTFKGNLHVASNLYLADPGIPLEDFDETALPVELFGDVFVDGTLYGNTIVIHGNLECTNLECNSIIVDGNINVTNHATTIETMHSIRGNINFGLSADMNNLIASEGSIYVEENLLAYCIKAFDTIYVGGDFIEAQEIVAGNTVTVNGCIETAGGTRISFQVLSGGFGKHHN